MLVSGSRQYRAPNAAIDKKSGFQSGKLPPVNAADDIDTLETLQALLYLTSVSLWFHASIWFAAIPRAQCRHR
jgi:hypothetical protein